MNLRIRQHAAQWQNPAATRLSAQARCSSRRAFTLIELILVLALLVVAVSIVTPRISGFIRGRALDSEARRLAALMHAGQARAISDGMTTVLWLDEKQNRYGLELQTPGEKGDDQAKEFSAAENVQVTIENDGKGALTTFKDLPAIRFLPDGMVDENSPQSLRLQDSAGSTLWLVQSRDRKQYEISDQKE